MGIRKFNESIDKEINLKDDFADLIDISDKDELYYIGNKLNYIFQLNFDDEAYIDVDSFYQNLIRSKKFIEVFKTCLKNTSFDVVYTINQSRKDFKIEIQLSESKDIIRVLDTSIHVNKKALYNKLNSFCKGKVSNIDIEDDEPDILKIYIDSNITDNDYYKIKKYITDCNLEFQIQIQYVEFANRYFDLMEVYNDNNKEETKVFKLVDK